MDLQDRALVFHKALNGQTSLKPKVSITDKATLSLAYTPGVAEPCKEIAKDKERVWDYTSRGNWVAVVTDGSAVLGLGNIGPEAGLPVMEGKAVLFKEFADVDAFPICLSTQNTEEIISAVKAIAPSFGGINLEDISAPRCFEIEERLKRELDIPVFHDDQHGTAVVVLAGLMNACRVVKKELGALRVVMSGAGAAGVAVTKMLLLAGVRDIVVVDSTGIIGPSRHDLNGSKQALRGMTNPRALDGNLADAVKGSDVVIGVSAPGILTEDIVGSMNERSIVFTLSNPIPEIMPELAKKAGAAVVATGRSDFPNQINNVLAFPGIFRGVLDVRARAITEAMKLAAAHALAGYVVNPDAEHIMPDVLDRGVARAVAEAVKRAAIV